MLIMCSCVCVGPRQEGEDGGAAAPAFFVPCRIEARVLEQDSDEQSRLHMSYARLTGRRAEVRAWLRSCIILAARLGRMPAYRLDPAALAHVPACRPACLCGCPPQRMVSLFDRRAALLAADLNGFRQFRLRLRQQRLQVHPTTTPVSRPTGGGR